MGQQADVAVRTSTVTLQEMQPKIVGQPVQRLDAVEKVTGSAQFGADLRFAGVLHGRVLRSPHAHARIVSIDTSRAEELRGVVAVVTGQEWTALGGEAVKDMPFLARGVVRYVGDPVAAVAATEEEIADEAVRLIRVQYEELPAVVDVMAAIQPGAPLVHENADQYKRIGAVKPVAGTNIINRAEEKRGDVEAGFAESDFVFEDTFKIHTVHHGSIEPHVCVCQWGADEKITLWVCNDGPHRLRKDLAEAMEIPLTRIRVVVPYIGGGYGGKGGLKLEPVAIEVAVDRETGQVEVLRIVAAHDVGKAINPLTVSGQIQGGTVCGMGTALTEEVIIDEKGRVLNPNLHDYKMPTALDVPPFKDFIVEANHRDGPFGAKGLGEPVTCPTAPALANAIEDAVGVRLTELPLSSEKVLKALQARQGAYSLAVATGGVSGLTQSQIVERFVLNGKPVVVTTRPNSTLVDL